MSNRVYLVGQLGELVNDRGIAQCLGCQFTGHYLGIVVVVPSRMGRLSLIFLSRGILLP